MLLDVAECSVAVSVVADEFAAIGLDDGVGGADFLAEGVKIVEVLHNGLFVGLGDCAA